MDEYYIDSNQIEIRSSGVKNGLTQLKKQTNKNITFR